MDTDMGGKEKPNSGLENDLPPGSQDQKKTIAAALSIAALWAYLQFNVFGVIVYAVYAVIVIAILIFPLWRMTGRSKWVLLIAGLPLLFGPLAEEPWITYRFEALCQGAGVHVYQKVAVKGYLDARGGGGITPGFVKNPDSAAALEKRGFQFYEYRVGYDLTTEPRRFSHIEKDDDMRWRITVLDKPVSRYEYGYSNPHLEVSAGWKLEKAEMRVLDRQTDRVIARQIMFKRYPGLIRGLWINLVGSGLSVCERPLDDFDKKTPTGTLPKYTFIPLAGE